MKAYGVIVLLLLELCIQASSTENTTQAYYFKLHIESSAFTRFSWLLGNITDITVNNSKLSHITITTDCQSNNCSCSPNYSWSKSVCKMHPGCCQNKKCPFNATCHHKNRVHANGSFIIKNGEFKKGIQENLTASMKSFYSTMKWFESLQITNLREGSIIGDFVMVINGPMKLDQFVNLTKSMQNNLNITFSIITTGFITINGPDLIGYNTNTSITCTTPVSTLTDVKWFIDKDSSQQRITNGTQATLTQNSLTSIFFVNQTSEVWKGKITCDYMSADFTSIIHRASVFLDVALLPQIFITSDPQFPNCMSGQIDRIKVSVKCIIDNSTEPYSVTWVPGNTESITTSIENNTTYTKTIYVDCASQVEEYNVTCIFKNRANNTGHAALTIPVIKDSSVTCPEMDEWKIAKANFTAQMRCNSNEVGFKSRTCTGFKNPGTWAPTISKCVNTNIWSLLTEAQNLQKGLGLVEDNAITLFASLKTKTEDQIINTFSNINTSVGILDNLKNASEIQHHMFNESSITDFLKSSSNLLNDSLLANWKSPEFQNDQNPLAIQYLSAIEGVVKRIDNIKESKQEKNVQLFICNMSAERCENTNILFGPKTEGKVYQTRINNLVNLLPQMNLKSNSSNYILSVIAENETKLNDITMRFPNTRLRNHRIFCVFFNFTSNEWSDSGCTWGGALKPNVCTCNHLSAFTTMMSVNAEELSYMSELTFIGLGFSICSLVLCLAIEFMVWNTVVKSNVSHFRHTVLVNISLSLLMAHCSFIAGSKQIAALRQWCLALTVVKHFCFLSVFFWMLCMSLGLLHQLVYVFVQLRKKVYLASCFLLGYICPLLIVICTIINYDNGAPDSYYIKETCWLKYEEPLKGSIHFFLIPVGIIVLVNMFSMLVVVSRVLQPNLSAGNSPDEKEIVRSVIRTVVLLTPTLGITWIFGFFIPILDLTMVPQAQIVNYGFTLLNSFQGFFILLTGCLGEKKVRDALLIRIRLQDSAHHKIKGSMTKKAAVKKK